MYTRISKSFVLGSIVVMTALAGTSASFAAAPGAGDRDSYQSLRDGRPQDPDINVRALLLRDPASVRRGS
jgi:hypothetical protein